MSVAEREKMETPGSEAQQAYEQLKGTTVAGKPKGYVLVGPFYDGSRLLWRLADSMANRDSGLHLNYAKPG